METDGIPPLKSLIAFQMVARCGSFSDAATILGLTQSGISRRIMRLEEDVGVELFERTASGVVLTRIGAEYAQEVAAALDVLTEEPMGDTPLADLENCTLTTHVAWTPLETRQRLLEQAVENVRCWLDGKPQNVITAP